MILTTIGLPNSGKSTVLSFIAEHIYRDTGIVPTAFYCNNGQGDLSSFLAVKKELDIKVLTSNFFYIKESVVENKVVLVDNLNVETLPIVEHHNGIIIRVVRNTYHKGSIQHQFPSEQERWIANVKADYQVTSFDESLKLLDFDVRLLYEQLKQNTKWKI